MEKLERESLFSLIARFVGLVRRFFKQEKAYIKQAGGGVMKAGLPVIILGCACLVFLALAGIFSLVTLVLLLNTWFLPWVSALLVTASLMLLGLLLGTTALVIAKKGARDARIHLKRIQEDMRWLKKN